MRGPVIGSGLVVSKDPDTGAAQRQLPSLADQGTEQVGHPALSAPHLAKLRQVPGAQRADAGGDLHRPPSALLRRRGTTAAYGLDEFEIAGGYLGEAGAPGQMRDRRSRSAGRRRARARGPHPAALPRGGRAVLRIPGLLRDRHGQEPDRRIPVHDVPQRRHLQEPAERLGDGRLRLPQDSDERRHLPSPQGRRRRSQPAQRDGAARHLRRWSCR